MTTGGRRRLGIGAVALAAIIGLPLSGGRVAGAAPRAFVAGETRTVPLTGSSALPEEGVAAVLVNITATSVTAPTFVTVWPTQSARPATSNLNPQPGRDTANLALVPIDEGGAISVYNHAGRADLVVDLVGWIPADAGFGAATARLLDTRVTGGRLGGGGVLSVTVPGVGEGIAVLNLTGVGATTGTYLTVWPDGSPQPGTSNLNLGDAAAAANLVLTPVGADGRVRVANLAGAVDVVVDLLGSFAPDSGLRPLAPTRLLDTRLAGTPATPSGGAAVPAQTIAESVAAAGGGGSGVLVSTLTGTGATAPAYVTAWSGVGSRPATSNLNLRAGAAVANLVVAPVADGGGLSLYLNAGRADLVVDAVAWAPEGGAIRALAPTRLYDSRTADASGVLRPPSRTVTYSVAVRGTVSTDVEAFAAEAQATLDDPRGWRGAGVSFTRVPSGGNFTLWLSQAERVPSFGAPCTVNYSCRVGANVVINEARWRLTTPVWLAANGSLGDYHHMVVNHEVGHWLGFGHLLCGGVGQPAPVMQQQSKGLNGCLPNPWPTERELAVLGA